MSVGGEVRPRRHLLVESTGPWRGPGCARLFGDATALSRAGHSVAMHLVADGVLAAVSSALPELDVALDAGVEVCVDDLGADERAITPRLDPRVRLAAPGDIAAHLLAYGADSEERDLVTVWH